MRYPGEETGEQWIRSVERRLSRCERGDYTRDVVQLGGLTLRAEQAADGSYTLVVDDPLHQRSGVVSIIWQDEQT